MSGERKQLRRFQPVQIPPHDSTDLSFVLLWACITAIFREVPLSFLFTLFLFFLYIFIFFVFLMVDKVT